MNNITKAVLIVFKETVTTALLRHKQVVKVGRCLWKLKEQVEETEK